MVTRVIIDVDHHTRRDLKIKDFQKPVFALKNTDFSVKNAALHLLAVVSKMEH